MKKKTTNDLITTLAINCSLTKKKAKEIVNQTFLILSDLVKNNDEVLIANFGKFKTLIVTREEVILNKKQFKVITSKTVSFSPSQKFNKYFRGESNE
ncbi:HU family DNA-binding protein [Spiroplasma sp. SV19]|uniref:HU family DNA-binding protein n=1 Tax=Spiroplasma sp. SV19 TaxID=2570468 RepID=UPI0024B82689|nr:HU family DNA-binding protein [Spiroplasma sp. SV19]WHQ37073.1 HU family DNA-binding protein [Spiroplasma sp. SV19]